MSRIDLKVPFLEKDEAKKLGARWDLQKRVWYVPEGEDPSLFCKWLSKELSANKKSDEMNFRASSYFIAESSTKCGECAKVTRVYGFLLPSGHEVLKAGKEAREEKALAIQWVPVEEPTILYYVEDLSEAVISQMQAFSQNYHRNLQGQPEGSCWENHCEHCKIQQGDWEIHHEPDGAFFPLSKETASKITLHCIYQPFQASARGGSRDIIYFCTEEPDSPYAAGLIDYMQKAPGRDV